MDVIGYVQKVQDIELLNVNHDTITEEQVEANIARCPDPVVAEAMIARIDEIRKTGNSIGGVVEVVARNVPAGLGSLCLFVLITPSPPSPSPSPHHVPFSHTLIPYHYRTMDQGRLYLTSLKRN